MSQPPASSAGPAPVRDHPDAAVVLVARRGGEVLQAAVRGLVSAAQTYGVDLLVLRPASAEEPATGASVGINIREISVNPHEAETLWRARALVETAADIVEFITDEDAVNVAWDDRLPFRLALLRNDLDRPEHLREALSAAGIPIPASGPA